MIDHFKKATWFLFDLDDTLHEFRKASSAAVEATLHLIIEQQAKHENPSKRSLTITELEAEYIKVLEINMPAAFVDGKTSHEYRVERFESVMNIFGLSCTVPQMQKLLNTYESTLVQNLQLKQDAEELLFTLEMEGKSIAILTEWPQDAQERTIAELGLEQYCNKVVTTNQLVVAKTDRLFARALDDIGVKSENVIMVGDSWERDIVPALEAGIDCVWLNEKEQDEIEKFVCVRGEEKCVIVVNSLDELRFLIDVDMS